MAAHIDAIKGALAAKLATVSGLAAATIHTRVRNYGGGNEASFAALFVAGGRVNGWEIEQESGATEWAALDAATDHRDLIVLRGYYGLADAADSAAAFRAIVEGVFDALHRDATLGGTATAHGAVQLRRYGFGTLGGTLCHYAEITLEVLWTRRLS